MVRGVDMHVLGVWLRQFASLGSLWVEVCLWLGSVDMGLVDLMFNW